MFDNFCFNTEMIKKPDDKTDSAGLDLRWCRLTQIKSGDEPIEILAATQDEGVGIFARWCKLMNEEWHLEVMSTEGMEWKSGDDIELHGIPRVPPSTFDNVAPVQPELSKEELNQANAMLCSEKVDEFMAICLLIERAKKAKKIAQDWKLVRMEVRLDMKIVELLREAHAREQDLPELFP